MAGHFELEIMKNGEKSRIVLSNPLKHLGFVPEDGTQIFVQGLPLVVSENRLAEYFGQAGEIFQIRLMMHHDLVRNRGFAFISYMFVEAAERAMRVLAKEKFMGCELDMNVCISNCRLFIGEIPVFMTQEDILRDLKRQGMRGIIGVSMNKNPGLQTEVNRGYAYVEFMTHQRAAEVKSEFYGNLTLGGKVVSVEWSRIGHKDFWEEENLLHVRYLPWAQTTDDLNEICLQFVDQESIKAIKKVRSYAFIHVVDRTTAKDLIRKLKDYYMNSRVEVSWSCARAPRRYGIFSSRGSSMIQSDAGNRASCASGWNRNVCSDSEFSSGDPATGTEQILHEQATPVPTSTYEETPDGCQFCVNYGEWDHTAFLAEFHETCRELENTKSPDAQQKLFDSYMLEHRRYPRFLNCLINLCLESSYSYCFLDEYAPGEYNVHLFDFMKVMGMLNIGS